MQPTIGRIVLYKLSAYEAESVNQRRRDAGAFNRSLDVKPEPGQRGRSGHVLHTGNEVAEGTQCPAVVVRTFGGTVNFGDTTVNLKVLLDGNDTYWATSRGEGGDPGQWSWPPVPGAVTLVAGTAETTEPRITDPVHYVSHGSPVRPDGTQRYASVCRAAFVTDAGEDRVVGLMVANPAGLFFSQGVKFHDGSGNPGNPECLGRVNHGSPFRYCGCGWTEPCYQGGTWHRAGHA